VTTTHRLLHCCYTIVTLLLHCCHTIFTLLSHCCYTVVTLLSHSCPPHRQQPLASVEVTTPKAGQARGAAYSPVVLDPQFGNNFVTHLQHHCATYIQSLYSILNTVETLLYHQFADPAVPTRSPWAYTHSLGAALNGQPSRTRTHTRMDSAFESSAVSVGLCVCVCVCAWLSVFVYMFLCVCVC
jgi:hypothetical protein